MLSRKRVSVLFSLCFAMLTAGASWQVHAQQQPNPDGWQFTVGLGFQHKPYFLGDDDEQVLAVPTISATYGQHWAFSVNKGIEYTVNPQEALQWGLALTPDMGRDSDGDNPFRISGDGTDDLVGLQDVDSAGSIRLFTKYTLNSWVFDAEVQQVFRDDSESLVSLGVRRSARIETKGPPLFLSGGIRIRAGDENALNSLVGVSGDESALSGLAAYAPDAGVVSVGLRGSAVLPLSKAMRIITILSVDQLGSDLEDSSLVTDRGDPLQTSLSIFLSYKLGAR